MPNYSSKQGLGSIIWNIILGSCAFFKIIQLDGAG